MTDIDAVRAYRDAWLRSQSLHGHAAALEAEVATLRSLIQMERQQAAAAEAALAKMNARHCLHCAMAYVDCPRAIELLDGGGPMDIECCSEWTPKEDEA